jgi:NDP-sugar pyrophosphorylase family protein
MAGIVPEGMPKVLIPVAGRPFLDFKLASLAAEGVDRVVLLLGHGAERVAEHLAGLARSGGRPHGMEVEIVLDGPVLLGTGGAVRRALPQLGDCFWVTYGDTYLRVPMAEAEATYRHRKRAKRSDADGASGSGDLAGLMTVFANADRWDRSNVRVGDGLVVEYRKGAPQGSFRFIDYGLLLLEAAAFEGWPEDQPFDLAAVLGRLVAERRLAAFEAADRFYEVGSPDGYREAEAFLSSSAPGSILSIADA